MGAQEDPTPPVVVQLTDEQFERVFARLDRAVGRLERALEEKIEGIEAEAVHEMRKHSTRRLALEAGGDVLVNRKEVAAILAASPPTVDRERQAGTIAAVPRWKGRFQLRSVLAAYDLLGVANDNDSEG